MRRRQCSGRTLTGRTTRVCRRSDGRVIRCAARATVVHWTVDIIGRFLFGLYATNGVGPAVERFSVTNGIAMDASASALTLMDRAGAVDETALFIPRARRGLAEAIGTDLPPAEAPGSHDLDVEADRDPFVSDSPCRHPETYPRDELLSGRREYLRLPVTCPPGVEPAGHCRVRQSSGARVPSLATGSYVVARGEPGGGSVLRLYRASGLSTFFAGGLSTACRCLW